MDDLVEGALDGRKRSQPLDHAVAALHGLAALHRLAIAVDRPGREVAFAVGERLEQLGRETVGEVIEDVFARRDVDLHVAPFLGRDLGQASLHQRLSGGDDLDDGGMTGFEVARDRGDQRRGLHGGDEVVEEALLRAFERRACGRFGPSVQRPGFAGDIGGLKCGVQVVVDDLECARIGIVDAHLLGSEPVLNQLVFDLLIGERAGRVEAERLQVSGEDFHGRDTARLDRFDELGAGGEGEIRAAPQTEALCIGEIVHRSGAGRRDIEHTGVWQGMLKAQARASLLGGRQVAAFALAAGRVLHGVALVEDDHSIEVAAQPIHDLLHPRNLSSRASDRSVA